MKKSKLIVAFQDVPFKQQNELQVRFPLSVQIFAVRTKDK